MLFLTSLTEITSVNQTKLPLRCCPHQVAYRAAAGTLILFMTAEKADRYTLAAA